LQFTPDGRLLSIARGATLRLWDLEDGRSQVLASWEGGSGGVTVSPDGQHVVYSSRTSPGTGTLHVLAMEERTSRGITTHGSRVGITVDLDPSGRFVVSGGLDGIVRVGPLTGEEPHLLLGHEAPVIAVAVSPDGQRVASGSQDGTVRLWPMPDMERPPFHTLPLEELLERLRALTNLRAVEDPDSSTGYKTSPVPFPAGRPSPPGRDPGRRLQLRPGGVGWPMALPVSRLPDGIHVGVVEDLLVCGDHGAPQAARGRHDESIGRIPVKRLG